MKKENTLSFYPIGSPCFIGTKDEDGHRPIRGEIDHVRIMSEDFILYSVRFWDKAEAKYYLAAENEITLEGVKKKAVGFNYLEK